MLPNLSFQSIPNFIFREIMFRTLFREPPLVDGWMDGWMDAEQISTVDPKLMRPDFVDRNEC